MSLRRPGVIEQHKCRGKGPGGKGICLESRYIQVTHVLQTLPSPWQWAVGAYGSLQLSIQPWICAPGTHYGWVDPGRVEYEVCLTLLHIASTGNGTPDFDLESSALSTWPHAPTKTHLFISFIAGNQIKYYCLQKLYTCICSQAVMAIYNLEQSLFNFNPYMPALFV